ncbi:MAG TPA: serine/threonine-protein kinase [Candidatus Hydrogenedentes bacterium]|nr:serine/threonine-protein kinase [Candidatus Hydrogenedentota bacterium]
MTFELPDRSKLYHFRIDRILGRGGAGTVYRGIDANTGQVVAVKLFHGNFFRNAVHQRDFAKSVGRFRQFNHPNVVRTFEFLEGDDGPCLIQEYVDGPDLKWYIANRRWDLQERLVIAAQICNGLQYIHEQGFMHHDLKPANILFTRQGIAKLTDYSLSRAHLFALFDNAIHEQVTPMYVAPELIEKKKATPQSDIYSFGITLYLLFAGKVPFEVDSLTKLYQCHLLVAPLRPAEVNAKCPPALSDIIMRMIEKKPEKRFRDCDELRIALSQIGKSRI